MRSTILPFILWLGLAAAGVAAEHRRPDIVLILADDMGFSDLGCFGSEIATPNLDALAQGGLRFTQFYNAARCCPTRASLLTGLYPHQAGMGHMAKLGKDQINEWYSGTLRPDTATIPEVLGSAGYHTYMAGKWHVMSDMDPTHPHDQWPTHRGFERYYGILAGAANYFDPKSLTRDDAPVDAVSDPEYRPEHYYLTDALGDQSVRFISDHCARTPDAPFFLYCAFTAAHWPMQAPAELVAAQKGRYDAGYEAIRAARYAAQRRLGIIGDEAALSPSDADWQSVKRKDWEARCMEVYAAMVERLDAQVGAIVAELRRQDRLDNTLILFLMDNGACAEDIGRKPDAPMPGPQDTWVAYGGGWANVSNTPFRLYKHFVHEGGIATPLIAHWPAGIQRHGELERQPGHLIDIMATCVDVAGATYPTERDGRPIPPMEGRSLVPAFSGEHIEREALFWEHEGNRALRVGDWKLVAKAPAGAWELYDMTKDRSELHDLASQQPDRVRAMVATWKRWAQRTHALPWPWKPAQPPAAP